MITSGLVWSATWYERSTRWIGVAAPGDALNDFVAARQRGGRVVLCTLFANRELGLVIQRLGFFDDRFVERKQAQRG